MKGKWAYMVIINGSCMVECESWELCRIHLWQSHYEMKADEFIEPSRLNLSHVVANYKLDLFSFRDVTGEGDMNLDLPYINKNINMNIIYIYMIVPLSSE